MRRHFDSDQRAEERIVLELCWALFQFSDSEMEQSWSLGWVVVLAKVVSASSLASDLWADERVDSRETRNSSSFIALNLLAATMARRAAAKNVFK